jgi:hypothetical protein
MQTAPQGTYSSTMACVTSVIKNEGPLAFYKVRRARSLPVIALDPALESLLTLTLGQLTRARSRPCSASVRPLTRESLVSTDQSPRAPS